MAELPEHDYEGAAETADGVAEAADGGAIPAEEARPEACPFCGEHHPRGVKCADWARLHGTATAGPWGSEGFAALPPPPPMPRARPAPQPPSALSPVNLLKGAIVLLALYGAIMLALTVVNHVGGGSTAAALPACSPDRVRQNLLQANALLAEANAATPQRVDGTAALALAPNSSGCNDELYIGYMQLLASQTLCFTARTESACTDRSTAYGNVVQLLGGS